MLFCLDPIYRRGERLPSMDTACITRVHSLCGEMNVSLLYIPAVQNPGQSLRIKIEEHSVTTLHTTPAEQYTREEFHDAVLSANPKIAVFDCDGTLWSGDAGYGFMVWSIESGLVSRNTALTAPAKSPKQRCAAKWSRCTPISRKTRCAKPRQHTSARMSKPTSSLSCAGLSTLCTPLELSFGRLAPRTTGSLKRASHNLEFPHHAFSLHVCA